MLAILISLSFGVDSIILICSFQVFSQNDYRSQCNDFILNGNEELDHFHGNHIGDRTSENVTHLTIQSMIPNTRNLTFIPRNIANVSPNLASLVINAQAEEISADHLSGLDQLQIFQSQNPIRYLPGNLFRNNPNLQNIQVTAPLGNPASGLEEIGVNMLGHLRHLQNVRLAGRCINENASTRLAILNLNQFLHMLCPSDERNDHCPISCLENIESIQHENEELRKTVEELRHHMREWSENA